MRLSRQRKGAKKPKTEETAEREELVERPDCRN